MKTKLIFLPLAALLVGVDPPSAGSSVTTGLQRMGDGKIKFSWPAKENRFFKIEAGL